MLCFLVMLGTRVCRLRVMNCIGAIRDTEFQQLTGGRPTYKKIQFQLKVHDMLETVLQTVRTEVLLHQAWWVAIDNPRPVKSKDIYLCKKAAAPLIFFSSCCLSDSLQQCPSLAVHIWVLGCTVLLLLFTGRASPSRTNISVPEQLSLIELCTLRVWH